MAITVAQDLATQNGAVGTSLTFSGITATAAGSLLVADIGMRLSTTPSTTVVTVTDNKGNAWQPAVVNDPAGLQTSAEIWFCPNAIAGVTSIQVTVGSAASMVLRFYEVTATGTVIWTLDRTSTATASSTAPDSGATSTTTQASEIVIASIVWATAVTISGLGPAGYTVDATNVNSTGNAVNGQNGYQVVSAQASFDFAGTLSGAHAWVASVATFKPVPPSPLSGQTPVARAPYNPAGQSPDDLNQLLGTHSTVSCWDNATAIASPSVVQFGGFQPLASASGPVAVSQGVSVAGGTIDRVVLPLSIASGIGADVTVGLYADSGGSPAGPPIAQVLVPREALAVPAPVAASQGGPAAFGAQLMTSWRQQSVFVAAGTPSLTAVGTTLIALGGDLAGVKVATVYTATAADQSVGPWAVAPVLPDVRQFAGTCCTPHYVVVTGGIDNTVYHNTVWTASVDANGNLGAWTVQTALPVPLALHAAVYSNGWVYLIGGYTTGTVAQATVYAGAI
ncbi:MAG: hypothetical protein ACRENL_11350, partial [Candidatus Dormibacteria bacterium]